MKNRKSEEISDSVGLDMSPETILAFVHWNSDKNNVGNVFLS